MSSLLQQMEKILESWNSPRGEDDIDFQIQKLETTRAALNLFVSGSGIFRHVLEKLHTYLFQLIDASVESAMVRSHGGAMVSLVESHIKPLSEIESISEGAMDSRRALEERMHQLVLDAEKQRADHQVKEQRLEGELTMTHQLLKHQVLISHRANIDDVRELIKKAAREKTVDEMSTQIKELEAENDKFGDQMDRIRALNGKYAIQALELSARLKAVTSMNEKFSAALTLQIQDMSRYEQENEVLRNDVASLQKLNKIYGEAVKRPSGTRPVCFTRGDNPTVPHLFVHQGFIPRRVLTKEIVSHIVSDIVTSRHGNASFSHYVLSYFSRMYGYDAVPYIYALDDATHAFDADADINMFGYVLRNRVSDGLYTVLNSEIAIVVEACDALDCIGGGLPSLSLPIVHVAGILFALYPAYSAATYERLVDGLVNLQTGNGFVHYGVLFPTAPGDHDASTTSFTFVSAFKEAFMDDVLLTMQLVEDLLQKREAISVADACQQVCEAFTEDLSAVLLPLVKSTLVEQGANDRYDTLIPTSEIVQFIRRKLVLRRGLFRHPERGAGRDQAMKRTQNEWRFASNHATPTSVNYAEIVNRCKTKRLLKAP